MTVIKEISTDTTKNDAEVLQVGLQLIIVKTDSNGNIKVNRVENPWDKNRWLKNKKLMCLDYAKEEVIIEKNICGIFIV